VSIAAKDDETWRLLKEEFKARRVEKAYLAYVYGSMKASAGRVVAEILRSSERPRHWYARATGEDDPRAAITDWKLLRQLPEAALLELSPKTGRTHQIRVHLASIGHAVVADHLYAAERAPLLGFARPALHALSIRIDGDVFEAPLPPDFAAVE
jgi:23S rRNA-/tRNA-specific pseudouridylate synthase